MFKKYPIIKWSVFSIVGVVLLIVAFGFWFMSLLPSEEEKKDLSNALLQDIPYISQASEPTRGKILAVVSSHEIMGTSGKKTGYELTELARPYYIFKANGFEVDIASPKGGKPPVVIDKDDMGLLDYAFLNDPIAQQKVTKTITIEKAREENYAAVYFVGGKGAMYDFPKNEKIQDLIRAFNKNNKVIGAVCHGPAALVNVTLENGSPYLKNRKVCGFTNEEELLLISNAKSIFPFLLQDKMISKGANFKEGSMYLKNVVKDGNLITGQNPWSTMEFAEAIIEQLGYEPKDRKHTAEENTINILSSYQEKGYDNAKAQIALLSNENKPIDRSLIGMHCFVSAMQYNLVETIDKIRLLLYAKNIVK